MGLLWVRVNVMITQKKGRKEKIGFIFLSNGEEKEREREESKGGT